MENNQLNSPDLERHFKDTDNIKPLYYRHTGPGYWYLKELDFSDPPTFPSDLIPDRIQVEYTANHSIQSEYVLTWHEQPDIHKILTGIRPTYNEDWYYGDIPIYQDDNLSKNLILLEFCPDRSMFRLYLFEGYYPSGRGKKNWINSLVYQVRHAQSPKHRNTG